MKKYLLITLLLLQTPAIFAQDCNCATEFAKIHRYIEKNYVGFKDKQKQLSPAGYTRLINEYTALAKKPHANEHCLMLIYRYLSHLRDNHVGIGDNPDGKWNTALIGQKQIIPVSAATLQHLKNAKGIEGIYVADADTTAYQMAVIKDVTPLHDYIGIIIQTKTPGWKAGMVKLELKVDNDKKASGVIYPAASQPEVMRFKLSPGRIGNNWHKPGMGPLKDEPADVISAKQIDPKTLYIKLGSFESYWGNAIDSVIKAYQNSLARTPYLILDLRDNTGGQDYTYAPVQPYIYTSPVHVIGVDVLPTDDNIRFYKDILKDTTRSAGNIAAIKAMIASMEAHKGKLFNIFADATDTSYKPLPYPLKIAILVNNECASSAEEFLLWARQSKKVIIMGQRTSGTLDYSNVLLTPFSCMPYVLGYPSTRSRRLDIGQGIDNIGIKPNVEIPDDTDWIKAAQKQLENSAGK